MSSAVTHCDCQKGAVRTVQILIPDYLVQRLGTGITFELCLKMSLFQEQRSSSCESDRKGHIQLHDVVLCNSLPAMPLTLCQSGQAIKLLAPLSTS